MSRSRASAAREKIESKGTKGKGKVQEVPEVARKILQRARQDSDSSESEDDLSDDNDDENEDEDPGAGAIPRWPTSQTLTSLSRLADTRNLPFLANDKLSTPLLCPFNLSISTGGCLSPNGH